MILPYIMFRDMIAVFSARASLAVLLLRTNKASIFSLWCVCFSAYNDLQIQELMNIRRPGTREDDYRDL